MKKFKKAVALSLALAMGLSLVACGDKKEETTTEATTTEAATTEAATDDATADDASASNAEVALPMPAEDSDPIYCYSWNTEFGDRLQYVKDKYPQYADLIKYENLGLGGGSDEYKTAIENAIATGGEKVPSIIACDDAVAKYFLASDAIVPVSDLGITADMYSGAYQYTIDYATIDGELKGMCWQATPGCFIYRTDIADEVFGTADPEDIQQKVKDWDTFLTTAEELKTAGYKILSGPGDAKTPIIDNKAKPWVEGDTVNFDDAYVEYMEFAKKLYDGEYTNNNAAWTDGWFSDVTGNVFGWFGCTWFLYWTLGAQAEGTDIEGKFNMCQGPVSYHWGGTYLGVTDACPNKELAALVMYTLCADEDVLYKLSAETLDYVNNKNVMQKITDDGKGASKVLGGEDPVPVFMANAEKIDVKNATEYDSTMNGFLDNASGAYNSGELATIDDAVEAVKSSIRDAYQNLTVE